MFQILMVLSSEQLARMLGFWGSKATQRTQLLLTNTKLELNYHRKCSLQRDGTYLCPVRGEPMGSPVVGSQILIVLSALHETSFFPVLSKQTPKTSLRIAEK